MLTADCGYKEGEARNDYGYGIGLGQWNIHIRFASWMRNRGLYYRPSNPSYTTMVREEFLKDHPHMENWQGQARVYLDEQKACLLTNPIDTCIRRWNYNAGLPYLYKVKRNVQTIRNIVNK